MEGGAPELPGGAPGAPAAEVPTDALEAVKHEEIAWGGSLAGELPSSAGEEVNGGALQERLPPQEADASGHGAPKAEETDSGRADGAQRSGLGAAPEVLEVKQQEEKEEMDSDKEDDEEEFQMDDDDDLEGEEEEDEDAEEDEDEESDESYVPDTKADFEGKESEHENGKTHARPAQDSIHQCVLGQRVEQLQKLLEADPGLLLQTDGLGRTPLHVALIRALPEVVKALLSTADAPAVQRCASTPFRGPGSTRDVLPTLHLALSAAPMEHSADAAHRCLEMLLAQPRASLADLDNTGRSVLHWACALGCSQAVDSLLQRRADPSLRDDLGNFALHYAIDSYSRPCVEALLRASEPALFTGQLHPFYRCIDRQAWEAAILIYRHGWPIPQDDIGRIFDFAAARGLAAEWNFVSERGVDGSGALEELQWPAEVFSVGSTALVTHPLCAGHGALPHDVDDLSLRQRLITKTPENPSRLEVLCGELGVLRGDGFRDLRWVGEPPPAPLVDVLRVHEYFYVHRLIERVRETEKSKAGNPFSKVVLDGGDTKITRDSWTAALRAAGCVLEAVDLVCNEQARNAFCAVRPPGHHLGPAGACNTPDLEDDPEGSQGFCLLNNVAVGAAYARCIYRHIIHRVAVVDIDVHHGNGTEAIVRHIKPKRHQASAPAELTLRGFTARVLTEAPPSCKPWLDPESDAESLFFASIHGYGGGFYPCTGKSCNESSPKIVNVGLRPDSSSAEFRDGMRTQILPELLAFSPDIIFVSAGFDGHEDDLIGNCRLVEEDFVWATQQLLSIANRCCKGRLVSVLEGGYNTRAEALSPFAQAVASHVRTLMHTSPNYSYLESRVPESVDGRCEELREADRSWVAARNDARSARRKKRRAEDSCDAAEGEAKARRLDADHEVPAAEAAAAAAAPLAPSAVEPQADGPEALAQPPQPPAATEAASAKEEEEMRLLFGTDEDEDPAGTTAEGDATGGEAAAAVLAETGAAPAEVEAQEPAMRLQSSLARSFSEEVPRLDASPLAGLEGGAPEGALPGAEPPEGAPQEGAASEGGEMSEGLALEGAPTDGFQ